MHITRTRRALAAAASTAVAAAGLAGVSMTSASAAAEDLAFSCTVSVLPVQTFTVDADTDLPASVEQGKSVKVGFTATVTLNEAVRGAAVWLYGSKVEGTAQINAKIGGQAVTMDANVPLTEIPTVADAPFVIPVSGSADWTPTTLGSQSVTLDGFTANLSFPQPAPAPAKPLSVPCVSDNAAAVVDTVEVTKPAAPAPKAASKTTAKVKVAKKSKKATATVTVKSGKKKATGKVTLKLKKGKKVVATKTVTLKKGKAKFTFKKKLKKGKYSLTASYKGNKTTKASKKVVKFKVKK